MGLASFRVRFLFYLPFPLSIRTWLVKVFGIFKAIEVKSLQLFINMNWSCFLVFSGGSERTVSFISL